MEDPEDLLVNACELLGWGLEINGPKGYVEINTGSSRQQSTRRRFPTVTQALAWAADAVVRRDLGLQAITG